MALTTVDFHLNFALNTSTKKFIVTDITDYSSQSVLTSDANGVLKITDPTGVIYENTNFASPDVDVDSSRINSTTIPIGLISGTTTPIPGTYVVVYTVKDNATGDEVSSTKTFELDFESPTASNTNNIDCISPSFRSTDTTTYTVGTVSPTNSFSITAVSTGSNTFSIAGKKAGLFVVGKTFYVNGSTGNDGTYTVTGVDYDKTNDYTVVTVASVTDGTVDGIIYTYVHKLFYPSVLELDPLVGYTTVLTTNTFYTGDQEILISTENIYDYANNVSITDAVSQTDSAEVVCDNRLCDVYCCISTAYNRYINNIGVNDTLSERWKNKFILATSLMTGLRNEYTCGQDDNVNSLTNKIKQVTECTDSCSCTTDEPTLISGSGSAGSTVVQSGGNGILVSPSTSGGVTTYTLTLSQSIVDTINSVVSVTLQDSATIEVNEVIDGSGNKTYTPAVKAGVVPTVKEVMRGQVEIRFRNATAPYAVITPSITVSDVEITNQTNLSSPTVADYAATLTNYPNIANQFRFSSFQTSANTTYKVHLEVVESDIYAQIFGIRTQEGGANQVYAMNKQSGQFDFRILSNIGYSTFLQTQDFISGNTARVLINFTISE